MALPQTLIYQALHTQGSHTSKATDDNLEETITSITPLPNDVQETYPQIPSDLPQVPSQPDPIQTSQSSNQVNQASTNTDDLIALPLEAPRTEAIKLDENLQTDEDTIGKQTDMGWIEAMKEDMPQSHFLIKKGGKIKEETLKFKVKVRSPKIKKS